MKKERRISNGANKAERTKALREINRKATLSVEALRLSNSDRMNDLKLGGLLGSDDRATPQYKAVSIGAKSMVFDLIKESQNLTVSTQAAMDLRDIIGGSSYEKVVRVIFPIFNEKNPRDWDEDEYSEDIHQAIIDSGFDQSSLSPLLIDKMEDLIDVISGEYAKMNSVQVPNEDLGDHLDRTGKAIDPTKALSFDKSRIEEAVRALGLPTGGQLKDSISKFQKQQGILCGPGHRNRRCWHCGAGDVAGGAKKRGACSRRGTAGHYGV